MKENNGHLETIEHATDQRPSVRPSQSIWNYCLDVAAKKGILPIDALKEIVFIGEIVSKIIESDGRLGTLIWKKPDGTEMDIRDLEKNNSTK